MTNPSPVHKGVIRGKTIELESETSLPEVQESRVTVKPVTASSPPRPSLFVSDENRRRCEEAWAPVKDLPPGEGLRRAFGAWADDAEELDRFLEWTDAQRTRDRPAPGL
jgi:hypothetical protein